VGGATEHKVRADGWLYKATNALLVCMPWDSVLVTYRHVQA
jgi:hypothetical protein